MIKFFRHIRQSLIMKNQSGKYFKYAIGEILLVVIGILIALQINNWNEERKENIKLKTAIQSVYIDLISDSLLINKELPLVYERNAIIPNLLRRSYATEANLDTLVKIMKNEFPIRWYSSPAYNTNTFSNLKSTGAFDILPAKIKNPLSNYYTVMASNQDLVEKTLDQYRIHLDDFVKQYNIIGRLYDENYNNSYLYNHTWTNIDSKDFTPRVAVMLAAYNVLYRAAKSELESNQQNIREMLPLLQPYLD
ncbi:DUF6090 family protein [Winogradskyella sp. A3E31]|uniref:DUF6090 family protein n=1 Tax=Winogradskyella sp. A3E31 TaxID=3349637 RepID=UPI00398AC2B8